MNTFGQPHSQPTRAKAINENYKTVLTLLQHMHLEKLVPRAEQ